MFRNLFRLGLIVAALFLPRLSHAYGSPQESDLRSKTVVLHSSWTIGVNVSTHIVLVDLSATNWPNPTNEIGYVNITNIYLQVDKLITSTATVKLGVMTYIDTSTGSIKYFYSLSNVRNVNNSLISGFYEADNSFRNMKVIPGTPNSGLDGTTPYLISNDILSGSSLFKSTTNLPAAYNLSPGVTAGVLPQLGDIILSIQNLDITNSISVFADMTYHYMAR